MSGGDRRTPAAWRALRNGLRGRVPRLVARREDPGRRAAGCKLPVAVLRAHADTRRVPRGQARTGCATTAGAEPAGLPGLADHPALQPGRAPARRQREERLGPLLGSDRTLRGARVVAPGPRRRGERTRLLEGRTVALQLRRDVGDE